MSSERHPLEKNPAESQAEVIVRMFPSDANPAGNVFGGEILKHIDMVAGIVAQRHSQLNAVTTESFKTSKIPPSWTLMLNSPGRIDQILKLVFTKTSLPPG